MDTVSTSKENTEDLISTANTPPVQNWAKSDILWSVNEAFFLEEIVLNGFAFFVEMVQMYADKTALGLTAYATVMYPVHLQLLEFLKQLRNFLIDYGYSFVTLLLVAS